MTVKRLISMLTWLVVGYLIGMTIGFTLFDPNLDLWALLGIVFSILGLIAGLLPFPKRHVNAALLGILGFYMGALVCIVLFGNPTWDFFNTFTMGGAGALLPIGGAITGVFLGTRITQSDTIPLFALVFGGFFGGLLLYSLATTLGVQVPRTMLGYAPFTIGAGMTLGVLALRFAPRDSKRGKFYSKDDSVRDGGD